MSRVYVIVEGQTEESFVSGPLAEALWANRVYVIPILLGGNTKYHRVERDILKQLKQDQKSYCTTMIDFYGLGAGFPVTPAPNHLESHGKAQHIENAVKAAVCRKIPEFRPDVRFIPYLSMHEYEALLFSDPAAFAQSIGQAPLTHRFERVRNDFPTPEDIDNDPQSAPSKRIIAVYL